jgi:hypothetical protein
MRNVIVSREIRWYESYRLWVDVPTSHVLRTNNYLLVLFGSRAKIQFELANRGIDDFKR